MQIFTIGFTQKSAEQFFGLVSEHKIEILVDIRLNNQSQLAGFTKGRDLSFFLNKICNCKYDHDIIFAPTKDILTKYKKGEIQWQEYQKEYNKLLSDRKSVETFNKKYSNYDKVLLLCSEATPDYCHRRLLAEKINSDLGYKIKHI